MFNNKSEVYVKIDNNNLILDIVSKWCLNDLNDYILIDSGYGDKYSQAQGNYFPKDKQLRDYQGRCNYKYENGEIVELTEDEKLNLFPVQEKEPTETEILQKQLLETQVIVANLQEQILLNQNGGK